MKADLTNFSRRSRFLLAKLKARISERLGASVWIVMKRFMIAFCAIYFIAVLGAMFITPRYVATAVLAPPANDMEEQSGAGAAGALSSLNLPFLNQPQSNNFVAAQKAIGTIELASYMMRTYQIQKSVLLENGNQPGLLHRLVHSLFDRPDPTYVAPTDIQHFLVRNIIITPEIDSGYVTLTYADRSGENAVRVLTEVIAAADHVIRERKRHTLSVKIAYLSNVIQTDTDVVHRDIFRNMLVSALANKMLIDTHETYAFDVFDRPSVPQTPTSPNLAMLLALLCMFSLVVASTITLAISWWEKSR